MFRNYHIKPLLIGNLIKTHPSHFVTFTKFLFSLFNYHNCILMKVHLPTEIISDVLTNPCERSPQPCQNQGTCISTGGSRYTCLCPEGFTGHNCQTGLLHV